MRLIDADALDDKLYGAMRKYDAYDSCETKIIGGIMEAQDLLDDAPTIDAVEVVRCKDCRSFLNEDDGWCLEMDRNIELNDFCSYGERKDDENNT